MHRLGARHPAQSVRRHRRHRLHARPPVPPALRGAL